MARSSDGTAAASRARGRVDSLIDLLRHAGQRDYIGEPVSQLAHALQSAHFARVAGASEAEIIAALLHDVGHICDNADARDMAGLGVADHETVGARYLRELGFGDDVTELVAGHVRAKRYLTWKNPAYAAQLSEASRQTLALQGGPMQAEEAGAFERDARFRSILRVRRWDELAKQPDLTVADLDAYRELLASHLSAL